MAMQDNTSLYELDCDATLYHGPFLPFSVPTPVGEFSLDRSRVPQLGRARVRYLYEKYLAAPSVHFDLTHGFSTYDPKEVNAELLEIILRWIKLMAPPGSRLKKVVTWLVSSDENNFQVIHEADFVVWRGSLTRVACSPFEKDGDGWKVACCRFHNVIFLCEYDSEAKAQKKGNESERDRLMTYWGHKFEQYVTTDVPQEKPKTDEPVSTYNEFCAMYKSAIGKNGAQFRLLYGAEMDCINSGGDFLEIKTQYHSIGYGRYFDLKSMKWWLQSFLVGIKKIVVGIRDDKGVVQRVQYLPIDELPRKAEKWQAATCFSFLHAYLAKVKEILEEEHEGVVLLTERLPGKKALMKRVRMRPTIQFPTDAKVYMRDANSQPIRLYEVRRFGEFSRIDAGDGNRAIIKATHDNVRILDEPLDVVDDPHICAVDGEYNLMDGREMFCPRNADGNRIDNLFSWCLQRAPDNNNNLRQVTRNADILIDRTTLSNIAATPQTKSRFGWKVACTRMGSTTIICPYAIEQELEHFRKPEEIDQTFRQAKLVHLLTGGWDRNKRLVADNSFHRVMTARLGDAQHGLRLLYSCQVDAVDHDDRAVEIRCERESFDLDQKWFKKGLKWYMQSRFSNASNMLVGMREDDHLVSLTQLPVDWLRNTAECRGFWTADVSYCFLYKILSQIRAELMQMPECRTLVAWFTPADPATGTAESLLIQPLSSVDTFLQQDFYDVFHRG